MELLLAEQQMNTQLEELRRTQIQLEQGISGLNQLSDGAAQLAAAIAQLKEGIAAAEAMTPEQQQEEAVNILNGLNFARKVMTTDGCDILILDEVLGLVDRGIIMEEDLTALVEAKDESMELVLTGIHMCDSLYPYADDVVQIDTLK